MKKYATFAEMNEDLRFEEIAGFKFKDLQVEDANTFSTWLAYLNRYEVGGGKTAVSTAVSYIKGVDVAIVTVPPILLRPWTRWLTPFGHEVVQYSGNPRERIKLREALKTARWIVVSHDIFRRDIAILEEVIVDRDYELIVDEAHAAKNIKTVMFKLVSRLGYKHDLALLTGTPINKPEDAFSYIKLKTHDVYRSWPHFENLHITGRDIFGAIKGYCNLDILEKNLAQQTISRTKKELHGYDNAPNYPDCTYALSDAHQKLYVKLLDEQLLLLPDGDKIDATTVQRLRHALQQIVLNWDYFSGDETNRSAGYDLLDLTVEQTECATIGKSKLIVWTNYKRTSKAVWDYLLAKGIRTVAAYSETKSQDSFDEFMENDNCRILVANPASAGAGLNPQGVCWESLTLEIGSNTIHTIQSHGRIDRVGQLHEPTIRVACAEGTIQVAIRESLFNNSDLVARVNGDKTRLRDLMLGRV